MLMYTEEYTIRAGDTLSEIADRLDLLSYRQILVLNRDIKDPNVIYEGQVIQVPIQVPMATYRVRPGDTLWRIIYFYNLDHVELYGGIITMEEVLSYNPMIEDPNVIYPGTIIYLPEFL